MTIKIIPNTDYRYIASSDGQIMRVTATGGVGRPIGYCSRSGYLELKLYLAGRKVNTAIHRLVARTFLGEPGIGQEVNHRDGNKWNNCIDNLEYVTKDQNMRHAIKHGLRWVPRGEKCKQTRLSEAQVEYILRVVNARKRANPDRKHYGGCALARELGVAKSTIAAIVRGKNWKHITRRDIR